VKTSTREQNGILHHIATQQGADQNYIEDGIQLLELASEEHQLFLEQEPEEKRPLLGFLVATASWKEGELSTSLGPPFDPLFDRSALTDEFTGVRSSYQLSIERSWKWKSRTWTSMDTSRFRGRAR
jgi:hypothetical protein